MLSQSMDSQSVYYVAFTLFAIIGFIFDCGVLRDWSHKLSFGILRSCAVIYGIISFIDTENDNFKIRDNMSNVLLSLQIVLLIYVMRYAKTNKVYSSQKIKKYYESNRRIQIIIENCICIIMITLQLLAIIFDTFWNSGQNTTETSRDGAYFFLTYCCGILIILIMIIIHGMYWVFDQLSLTRQQSKQSNSANDNCVLYKWFIVVTLITHAIHVIVMKYYPETSLWRILTIEIQHVLHAIIYIFFIVIYRICGGDKEKIKRSMVTQMEINNKMAVKLPPLVSPRKARKYQKRFLTVDTKRKPTIMNKIPENRVYTSPLTTSTMFSSTFGYSSTTNTTEWFTSPQNSPKVLVCPKT